VYTTGSFIPAEETACDFLGSATVLPSANPLFHCRRGRGYYLAGYSMVGSKGSGSVCGIVISGLLTSSSMVAERQTWTPATS